MPKLWRGKTGKEFVAGYLKMMTLDKEEFKKRLGAGDPAATVIFAAGELLDTIGQAAEHVAEAAGRKP